MRQHFRARHADRIEVSEQPLLVPQFLVHVREKVVAHLAQGIVEPAGRGDADRVEVPDDVVDFERQAAVALDAQAARERVDHGRMGLEGASGLAGAHHELAKEGGHRASRVRHQSRQVLDS